MGLYSRDWWIILVLCLAFTACGTTEPFVPQPPGPTAQAIPKPPPIDFSQRTPLPYKMTIAILPLENLTKKDDLAWLSAGIPESLISKLQNIRSLRMVERMRIKNLVEELKLSESGLIEPGAAQKAGRLLGADTVLIGSFVEFQGTVQINCRLVRVETGTVIHAVDSTGLLNRIFQLQDRLAEKLVATLGVRMETDEAHRLAVQETNSLTAYENYVRGRDHYFQFNRPGYEEAARLYREAVRLDPGFALAHAGMADTLATLGFSRKKEGEAYESLFREAREAAKKAIALNPNLSDGHRALAHVYNNDGSGRIADAAREAQQALTLNPNDAEAWYLLAQTYTYYDTRDLDRAQIYYENAIQLNPDYAMAYNSLGWFVYLEKKWYDKAVEAFERAIQISPNFTEAYDSLGEAYFRMGKYPEAARNFRKALELQPSHKHAARRLKEAEKAIR